MARRIGGTIQPSRSDHKGAYEDGLRRFVDEARRLESFRDCRVIVIFRDLFRANGTAYLVMDFVEGLPLSELLARREANGQSFTESDLLNVIRPVLEGLQVIHAAGVYRRDIKPSNILICRSDSHPVLIDFGAAKQVVSGLTKSLAPYTDGYAAMEQVGEGEIGPWTDLYGLGAVMWCMVAGGSPPWTPPNPLTVQRRAYALMQGQEDPMPPAQQIGARRFTRNLLQTIDACLAVSHSERLSSCEDLMAASKAEVVEPSTVQPQTTIAVPAVGTNEDATTRHLRQPKASSPEGGRNRSHVLWVAVAILLLIVLGGTGYAIIKDNSAANRAERGDPNAQLKLGEMYAEGRGVPQDNQEAVKWFRLSAEQGNAGGQFRLGEIYAEGRGVPQDNQEALKWFRLSAEQGNAVAQYSLGFMFANGLGVPQDNQEAVKWYRLSAEQGNAVAQFFLGEMYAEGRGVPYDHQEAVKWYQMAGEQDDAQYFLGGMYAGGTAMPQEAVKWYRLSAEQGNADAQFSLGGLYRNRNGGEVPQDNREAVKWYRLSAEQGNADAQ
ncbi:MAG: serine/threonine-protein kinase, partial [Bacteroidota bacterium]|nr:serine/threonine-protein kinase [Bacteroidota bacterium]